VITLQEAQERLRDMVCPRCLRSHLSAVLHLPEGGGECLCTARCDHCGHEFPVEGAHLETLETVRDRIAMSLRATPCPTCRTRDFELDLRCDWRDRECAFWVRCRACGDSFRVIDHQVYVDLIRDSPPG
jgi:DNA-directed RNA polymerase subunit RPC12/RpoP